MPKVAKSSPHAQPASKPSRKPRTFSLSFERRLHRRTDFLKFFEGSDKLRLSECVIFKIPNRLSYFRLGITLKARGTSLERNRVKRIVREEMRRLAPQLGAHDYNVVIPATKRMNLEYAQRLRKCLQTELTRVV